MQKIQKNEEVNDIEIKIYPNPAKDCITLGTTKISNDMQFQIINTKGQVLKNGQILSEKETIDISRLENGMYMIRIISKELKFSKTEKLIKKD
ncbi:MAG: T9SS type A sorting domain-containing protein [Bacteroidales bacterium]|nr:T9SS type A sorting domain-containing protein [Bacteroidales bacterium]